MLDMGILEIGLVLLVALLVFGPGSVPKLAKELGTMLKNFRKITTDLTKDFTKALDAEDKKPSSGTGKKSTGSTGTKSLENFLSGKDDSSKS